MQKSPRTMISHWNLNALVISLRFPNYYTYNNLPTVPRAAYGAL
jgi:hypothetical protein